MLLSGLERKVQLGRSGTMGGAEEEDKEEEEEEPRTSSEGSPFPEMFSAVSEAGSPVIGDS